MRTRCVCLFAFALILRSLTAAAQTPPADPHAHVAKIAMANIVLELDVNKPAKDVWARVGKFCGIRDWAQMDCTILKAPAKK